MPALKRFACLALLPLPLLFATGCIGCKTRGQAPVEFRDGKPIDEERTVYETSAAFGEYLHFPPGRTYDLIHGLVNTPHVIDSYIAFKRVIEQGDEGQTGNYAEGAGNLMVVECQDMERVRVRNDSCADLYLRVVLEASPESTQADRPCP